MWTVDKPADTGTALVATAALALRTIARDRQVATDVAAAAGKTNGDCVVLTPWKSTLVQQVK